MISENSTHRTQARAFSFFAFTGNLGIFLGPILGTSTFIPWSFWVVFDDTCTGGALAKPATVFPSIFGHIQFFHDYPYALPTIVTGSIGVIATVTSALFIKEVRRARSHLLLSSLEALALFTTKIIRHVLSDARPRT